MQEFFFWIYIIITLPLWVSITGIWILLKAIFYIFLHIIFIFLSIFSKNFDLWNVFLGFIRTIGLTFEDADIILNWFKEFYYESPFLAFILGFLCFSIFWQTSSRIRSQFFKLFLQSHGLRIYNNQKVRINILLVSKSHTRIYFSFET